MRNEDELAGLLGHELGHLVAQQVAMEWTELFRKVIGVNSVSDRHDIFNKYQLYVDNQAKKTDVMRSIAKEEEPNQIIADRLGLYATSVSGYSTASVLFNRTASLKRTARPEMYLQTYSARQNRNRNDCARWKPGWRRFPAPAEKRDLLLLPGNSLHGRPR